VGDAIAFSVKIRVIRYSPPKQWRAMRCDAMRGSGACRPAGRPGVRVGSDPLRRVPGCCSTPIDVPLAVSSLPCLSCEPSSVHSQLDFRRSLARNVVLATPCLATRSCSVSEGLATRSLDPLTAARLSLYSSILR
jgi:hypothetical protein